MACPSDLKSVISLSLQRPGFEAGHDFAQLCADVVLGEAALADGQDDIARFHERGGFGIDHEVGAGHQRGIDLLLR